MEYHLIPIHWIVPLRLVPSMGDDWSDVDGFLREASGSPQRLRAGSPPPSEPHKWKFMMFWFEIMLYFYEVSLWQYFCKEPKMSVGLQSLQIHYRTASVQSWTIEHLKENTTTLLLVYVLMHHFASIVKIIWLLKPGETMLNWFISAATVGNWLVPIRLYISITTAQIV